MRAVRAGQLDRIVQLVAPLDVLAQQVVAEAACEDWQLDDLLNLFRRATPFRALTRESYLEIVDMLATRHRRRRRPRRAPHSLRPHQ